MSHASQPSNLPPNIGATDSRTRWPELYSAPSKPGAEDELAVLLAVLCYVIKPRHVLETGTAYGTTAVRIARALEANGVGKLHTIEQDRERLEEAYDRLGVVPQEYWEVIPESFENVVFPPELEFDLVFFDATYRVDEFHYFRRWTPPGTHIVLHDTGLHSPKVRPGVLELEEQGWLKLIEFTTPRGFMLGQVLKN